MIVGVQVRPANRLYIPTKYDLIFYAQGIGKTSLLEQLRQEGASYRKKTHEHWAKRMGNKNINVKTSKGANMSTVGVDIGIWVYDKKLRGQNSKGPVVFR